MRFTDPFPGRSPERTLNPNETLRALRIALASELDAVSLYQSQIEGTGDARIQAVLARIRDDEKEHVSHLTTLIALLDNPQMEYMARAMEGMALNAEGNHKLLNYPSIAEQVADLGRRIEAISKSTTGE